MRFRAWPLPLRLHRSTYVVAGLIAIVMLLANVPGTLLQGYDSDPLRLRMAHGWPWLYVTRELDANTLMWLVLLGDTNDPKLVFSKVPQRTYWWLVGKVKTASTWALLADVAVALAVIFLGSMFYEIWRRRRNRLLQFHLTDLLVLTTLAAIGLSWFSVEARERAEEQKVIAELGRGFQVTYRERLSGPHWLRQLAGDGPFTVFDRVESFTLRPIFETMHIEQADEFHDAEQLLHLRHLEDLEISGLRISDGGVQQLTGLKHLRCLDVSNTELSDADLDDLARMRFLEVLNFFGTKLTESGLSKLSALTHLKHLYLPIEWMNSQAVRELRIALPHCSIVWKSVDY
jgi:hypothetical protein